MATKQICGLKELVDKASGVPWKHDALAPVAGDAPPTPAPVAGVAPPTPVDGDAQAILDVYVLCVACALVFVLVIV